MKTILLASLLLTQVVPGAIERQVPYPLPLDFNECVRIVVKKEFQKEWGKLPVWEPPFNPKERYAIQRGMELKIGKYEFCDDKKS